MKAIFRNVLIVALACAVAAVLIAPSVEAPETILREHHVTTQTLGGHASGNIAVSFGAGSILTEAELIFASGFAGSAETADLHRQTFFVLRC